jgi:hypothetical protein
MNTAFLFFVTYGLSLTWGAANKDSWSSDEEDLPFELRYIKQQIQQIHRVNKQHGAEEHARVGPRGYVEDDFDCPYWCLYKGITVRLDSDDKNTQIIRTEDGQYETLNGFVLERAEVDQILARMQKEHEAYYYKSYP